MTHSRLLTMAFCVLLIGGRAAASDETGPPSAVPKADAASGVVDLGIPPPPPMQPLAAELTPGFSVEFSRLLSTEGRLARFDKADREALQQFYTSRRNEPVWVTDTGLSSAAQLAVAEMGRADDWGLDASAFVVPNLPAGIAPTRDQQAEAEIALSLAVLRYARHARGGRAMPLSISRNLDRVPQLLEPLAVIEAASGTVAPDAYLRALHPQHPQFERLRQHYLMLKRNEAAQAAAAQVELAVAEPKNTSRRKKKAAKKPAGPTLTSVLVNMEQWRWMPADLGSFYVWVNIPEYTLRVVKDDTVIHSERVVVGRPSTQTPVFSDEMKQVIFHPYWGVPDSIKKNEILPSLARGNIDILERQGLRVSYRGRPIDPSTVDWSKADMRKFHVYQPPSANNALGIVKFRFPNKHDVYMHDTPSKRLFNANARAFSHGCMRVRNPLKLAELVLGEDRGWTASRVDAAVRRGPKDNQVNLVTRVPVHMTYFTVWVDDDGSVKTFADIYGHEQRIALGISGRAGEIRQQRDRAPQPVVEARKREPRATARTASTRGDRDWMRRVFQY